MKLQKYAFLALLSIALLSSCRSDDDADPTPPGETNLETQLEDAITLASNGAGKSFYKLPLSNDLGAIPQDPNNPLTPAKVALGQLLYHETGLGLAAMMDDNKGSFSCSSCHFASAGFQAGRFQGIGDGGMGFGQNGEGRVRNPNYTEEMLDVQPVRSPSVLNTAYQEVMLWNGQFGATGPNVGTEANWTEGTPKEKNNLGFHGIETQAIAGLGVHRMNIDEFPEVIANLGYTSMFNMAFSDVPEDERYSTKNSGLAIAAYERTLLANEAPFQRWLQGETDAMSPQEKRGALLFFGEANCASCHNGPGLNSMEFHAIGMNDMVDCPEETFKTTADNVENLGRGGFTGIASDNFKFKVPQLYNLTDSPFYGHGASFRSLQAVVRYKNDAIPENSTVPDGQLADEFKTLNLTDSEINDLVIFLRFALYDANLNRYQPNELPSGNCFPFNDPIAAQELGCD